MIGKLKNCSTCLSNCVFSSLTQNLFKRNLLFMLVFSDCSSLTWTSLCLKVRQSTPQEGQGIPIIECIIFICRTFRFAFWMQNEIVLQLKKTEYVFSTVFKDIKNKTTGMPIGLEGLSWKYVALQVQCILLQLFQTKTVFLKGFLYNL